MREKCFVQTIKKKNSCEQLFFLLRSNPGCSEYQVRLLMSLNVAAANSCIVLNLSYERVESGSDGCMCVFVLCVHDKFLARSCQIDTHAAFAPLVLVTTFGFNSNAAADEFCVKLVQTFYFFSDELFESFGMIDTVETNLEGKLHIVLTFL